MLWLARGEFYRGAKLLDQSFTVGWVLSFAHGDRGRRSSWACSRIGDVEYSQRAVVAVRTQCERAAHGCSASLIGAVILFAFGLARLLRPAPLDAPTPTAEDMQRVKDIVAYVDAHHRQRRDARRQTFSVSP